MRNSTFNDSPIAFSGILNMVLNRNNIFNRISPTFNQSAIILSGVSYSGQDNVYNNFDNTISNIGGSSLALFSENNSVFNGNGNGTTILNSVGPARILLDGNVFSEQLDHAIRIENNNVSTEIINNQFATSQSGLRDAALLVASNNISIRDNLYNGVLPFSHNTVSSTFWITSCVNVWISSNNTFTGFNGYGTQLFGCDTVSMYSNSFELNDFGISISSSSRSRIESNLLTNNSISGLRVNNSARSVFHCNTLENNSDGLNVSNSNIDVFFSANIINANTRGLVYQPSTTAPQQINRGNTFSQNLLGAIFEGSPSLQSIILMSYLYNHTAPGNLEFPGTVIPFQWFQGNSDFSLTCILPFLGDEDEIKKVANLEHIQNLIHCTGDELTDGRCFYNLLKALQLIQTETYLLENESIYEFYYQYAGSNLALLPSPIDVMKIIVQPMEGIPVFPEPLDPFNPTLEELDAIAAFGNLANDIVNAHKEAQDLRVEDLYTFLNSLDINGHFELQYLQSIEWLIAILSCKAIEEMPLDDIQKLAESCIKIDGPAVLIAKDILSGNRITFEENINCHEETEIQFKPVNDQLESAYIYPNPVQNVLHIPQLEKSNNTWSIIDINGRVVREFVSNGNNMIDVYDLAPGMYILKEADNYFHNKFIKY